MAVGEFPFPDMPPVNGVSLGTVGAGIKKQGRDDMLLFAVAEGSTVAGVFTQNAFCAAPVTICREHLQTSSSRFLLINSGNANACTGERGRTDALQLCESLAKQYGLAKETVLPFSTGVIGEHLPVDKMQQALPELIARVTEDAWAAAAKAIMTTDTRPKGATCTLELNGVAVTVNGISKGAGMINPNMATMLGFVATDAAIDQSVLQTLVREVAGLSFNRITIDGDTSTNDACMLIASGKAGNEPVVSTASVDYQKLKSAVADVCMQLAQMIVADGEGATKFVAIDVQGGANHEECLKVAYAVAHSPLIKTALFASDPNWGRIVAAIGYAGVEGLDASKVRVRLNDVVIVENGCRADSYTEEQGQKVMSGERISVHIDLGRGNCSELLWTTDLSYEYVRINADYRT
ncbi:bifunctional glutamate N-acetyltransferase/amino-acid acetyltransferase ArgJ [Gilvimarinus sp. SDUM040013]|uniref:Arginine biosynthesis bifunctional protein ArgJ n=1 Tax=Gilvimarinus gilvus TaxID=3058038 RepID=A0ABU4RSS4_9GAMM|nr:bifunctional glutamate N-acetyltransferase/amino-acid acetyltransferase ArgJ [Gilvimarinus sp. SDUM040013]MDO3388382.1 bifunctional glutamate N-acetyltransferase/amino-acid acetyltransferase ArgJ [Gilvimarinus sp. SDUM040013]MDX6847932.1 bifunctional glutamate N-acetyltransferase/amino-acid acetyltransferase ArgJ [Gilvimarinus sp. SDUM040013]